MARLRKVPTRGDDVIAFIEGYCRVPEGMHVGQPIRLNRFQKKFIWSVYDNPHGTRRGILSVAKKNGKTTLIAALLLAHIIGPEKVPNSQIVSGAMAKEQAALVYGAAVKMIELNPALRALAHFVPSSKRIIGTAANVEYRALAAEKKTTQGISPVLALLDETGQVVGPSDPFVEAIITSQGAHDTPLLLVISTQAPSDADLLSIWIDDALRGDDPHVVCHLYAAAADCDLLDTKQWRAANPGLGEFRSLGDLRTQLQEASRLPSREASVRNLLLNQRIALEKLWLAPSPWRDCRGPADHALFRNGGENYRRVAVGIDLSARNDLTAAVVACADDEGVVHLRPYVFTPLRTLSVREQTDRAPYTQWINEGHLVGVPGATVDYDWLCAWLRDEFEREGIEPEIIAYDKWRIDVFTKAAEAAGFAYGATWRPVQQGFFSMSPRIEAFEALILAGRVRHGGHPLLNRAAASAIAVMDPAGNRKLDKALSTQRIDPLVAAVMAAFEVSEGGAAPVDITAWVA